LVNRSASVLGPLLLPWVPVFQSLTVSLTIAAKIIYVFYCQKRETNRFLQSNGSVTQHQYIRIFALACVDILLTLPLGLMNCIGEVLASISDLPPGLHYQFYYGWNFAHSDWDPIAEPYPDQAEVGSWRVFEFVFPHWTSPFLAIVIFVLFGLTYEARTMYWRGVGALGRLFGWTPPVNKRDDIGEIQFCARQITLTEK
jgi:hypothetical protein